LGQVWATALIQHLQAKVTFIGSSPPSDPEGSAEIHFIVSDISSRIEMEQAIAQAEAKFGAIQGIFYSTPMSNAQSMALIPELTSDHWHYNDYTKVRGLTVLAEILHQRSAQSPLVGLPAFCFLQSSLSSVVGGLGLAAYAAANRYIDSFIQQQVRQASPVAWLSINWDQIHWNSIESESLAQKTAGFAEALQDVALSAAEVWKVTQKILTQSKFGQTGGQIVVSKTPLNERIQQATRPPVLEPQSHTRPQLAQDYMAPQTEIEQAIAQIWQELLGLDQVGIHDSFFELGGHSLLAIQAIARLRSTFQVDLPMRSLLFEAPTIAGIAALIASQQPQADELAAMAEILHEVQTLSPAEAQQLTAIEP
jgi:acyl carrier protein/NAD(P)-dependent dehydrogenase (short-subunit alcohol dehydrogenase family)